MKKRPTILDIAVAAGVTDGTVSRALTGSKRVKEATRLQIQAIADKMGYRPHLNARALKQGSSGAVGIFCEGGSWMFYNDYYGQLLAGVARGAERDGQRLIFYLPEIAANDGNPENDRVRLRGLEGLSEGRVDGGIVVGGSFKDLTTLGQLKESGLPMLLLSPDQAPQGYTSMASGLEQRMVLATNALLSRGRRRLGLLGLFQGGLHNSIALAAMSATLHKQDKKAPAPVLAEVSNWDLCAPDTIMPALKQLLAQHCDGWIVSNASQAAVILDLLAAQGIRVPEEISLISFGPMPAALRGRALPLAIVDVDLQAEGERAFQLYLSMTLGLPVKNAAIQWTFKPLPKSTLNL